MTIPLIVLFQQKQIPRMLCNSLTKLSKGMRGI